ncbi:MAG: hypothetical protein ACRD44_14270, partial [Bryobacteraceae bacterium]
MISPSGCCAARASSRTFGDRAGVASMAQVIAASRVRASPADYSAALAAFCNRAAAGGRSHEVVA